MCPHAVDPALREVDGMLTDGLAELIDEKAHVGELHELDRVGEEPERCARPVRERGRRARGDDEHGSALARAYESERLLANRDGPDLDRRIAGEAFA
jgi:hypothetical protein